MYRKWFKLWEFWLGFLSVVFKAGQSPAWDSIFERRLTVKFGAKGVFATQLQANHMGHTCVVRLLYY